MRICIPTEDNGGLQARAHAHFGSARYFTLVDTETGDVEVLANQGSDHVHGSCSPLRQLRECALDAVVCRGMGRRALATLKAEGIDVYVTQRDVVNDIVQTVNSGESKPLTDLAACQGHGHGSGHEGPSGHGQQRRFRRHGV
jgi:predicted Fe-Mo cluster-binding NifX family protein